MKQIRTVGIVGAGTMGSALAQKFAQEGFKVIIADISMNFVEKGLGNIRQSLAEGVQRKVFSDIVANQILLRIKGTDNLNDLKACELLIEAIYEDFKTKYDLFSILDKIVGAETIIATNTSSFSVTELSASVSNPQRFIGLHFFYHAAKNRLVEIIPGEKTSMETCEAIRIFSAQAGKDAITCKDAYGFVVNRFFVPWLNESVRLFEEEIATKEEIDSVCMSLFGIGMGPFALMNATGVPVAYHAEKTLEIFGSLYKVSRQLKLQAESKKQWEIYAAEDLKADPGTEEKIKERMLGVVFFVCSQILDEKICSPAELNRGAKIGLRWKKGPVELMRQAGEKEVLRLVSNISHLYQMNTPGSIGEKYWEMESVKLTKNGSIAVIMMSQPENLNALSEGTMKQLNETIDNANKDKTIETIFILGAGKAFVAGADIKFFLKNIKGNNLENIEAFTQFGQKVFEKIDNSPKKVIAVVNGLALGGGLELALCADVILALPKAQFAFPETGIGIYPGLGGTQRSARKIGKGLSKFLIHTGKLLSANDAYEIGLVDDIISMEEMFKLISGEKDMMLPAKITLSERWKSIRDFFEKNSLTELLAKNYSYRLISPEETEKIVKTIKYKAPIALQVADKLIDEEKGCESELVYLKEIFSTSDALLGLSSIGKKVEFTGK